MSYQDPWTMTDAALQAELATLTTKLESSPIQDWDSGSRGRFRLLTDEAATRGLPTD